MFCPRCGSQISDGARFCPVCGNVMEGAGARHAAPAQHAAPAPNTAPARHSASAAPMAPVQIAAPIQETAMDPDRHPGPTDRTNNVFMPSADHAQGANTVARHAAPAAAATNAVPRHAAPAPAPQTAPDNSAQPASFQAPPASFPGQSGQPIYAAGVAVPMQPQHTFSAKRVIPCVVAALALVFSLMPWFATDQNASQLSGYAAQGANFLSQLAGQNNDYRSQLSLSPEYNVWNLGEAGKVIANYQEMADRASDLASSLSDSYSDSSDDSDYSDYYDSYDDDDDYDSDYYDYSACTDAASPVVQASASVTGGPRVQVGQVVPIANPNYGKSSAEGLMIVSMVVTGLWAIGLVATIAGAVLYLVKGFKIVLPVGCVFLVLSAVVFELGFAPAVGSIGSATAFPVLMALCAIVATVLALVLRENAPATPAYAAPMQQM